MRCFNSQAGIFQCRLKLVALLAALLTSQSQAAKVPPEVTNVVTFIYLSDDGGKTFRPDGTGFFVSVKLPESANRMAGYLVTARHVLRNPAGQYYERVWVRQNKLGGGSEMIAISLSNKDAILEHPTDPTVDLAAVRAGLDQKVFEWKFLPEEMLTTKEDFKSLRIGIGSDVFFTGMFVPFTGSSRNYPVTRFGRIAMLADEKIPWQEPGQQPELLDLYLLETQSFGGNSGSPVFFYLGADREPGSVIVGPPVLKLAGVMKGNFNSGSPVVFASNAVTPLSFQNIGIAAVVPSYLLYELLFSDALKKERSAQK